MDKILEAETKTVKLIKEKINYKAEIAKMLAQMDAVDERIKRNQLETEKLRTETRIMLAEIRAGIN